MDNETLASLLRGRNRAGQPVDATANIIGPAMSALGNTIYGAGRGALTAMAGLPGDINQLITDNIGTLVNAQGLPTTKDIQDFLPLKPTSYEGKLAQKLGEFVPVNPTPIAKGAVAIAKPVGKAMGEQAYRMTEDMLQKQGMMPSIVAYHGTPHNIEGAFDISKVGTGEGAQAYGHGMYYAENPNVAKEYQKNLSGYKSNSKSTLNRAGGDFDEAIQKTQNSIEHYKTYPFDEASKPQAERMLALNEKKLQELMAMKAGIPEPTGNLYKVDIPDEYVPKMLDFDSPISKQPKEFVELLKDVSKNENFDPFEHLALAQTIGKHPRNAPDYKPTGEELMNNVSDILGIERNGTEFSKIMKEYGLKGIRYTDEGSRNWRILPPDESVSGKWTVGKWPGGGKETKYFDNEKDAKEYLKQNYTSNFVVFDPKEVKILEKNSKPVDTLENVVAPLKEKGLTLDIYESKNNPNKLVLSKIEVPKELRKSGVGSNAMQELTGFADKQNKTITLSPSTDFGGSSVSRLKDFYKRFGFVENKGRYKDYSISESMYRLPTKLSRKDIIEEQVNNLK